MQWAGPFLQTQAVGWTLINDGESALEFADRFQAAPRGFYGGGTRVLIAQAIGSAIVTVSTFSVAMAVMLTVNAMGILRISEEGEIEGMDLHEHGISAYPEYVITALASPAGSAREVRPIAIPKEPSVMVAGKR